MQGKVKFFNSSKGYGFIVDDETGDDVFVHVTSLNGLKINEGDKVEYEIEEGERGKTATNIQLV
tara:strand:- start:613 stop:804 length:192 start_codon:yes stop_codon:yes gene_type:complete